ncbi:DNA replication factor Dna2-domain-containing protein, partial [Spinellus fusiger]
GWLMNIPLGDGSSNITVDDEQNFIVMLPHILLSATDIAGASSCTRRVVLGQKTKRTFELSRPIVHGEILHRVIQDLMSIRDFSMATIKSTLWKSICYHRERLFLIDEDENMAYTLLLECVDSLSRFGTMYIHPEPQQHGVLEKDLRAHLIEEQGFKTVCIQRVVGIEELLWSKLYGIRGMVDATVEIKSLPNNKVLTIPLELKTGRINRDISHRTQTMLYALLMSDRYETDMKFSALYYSRTNSLSLIDGSIDIPRLIRVRNRLATAINRKSRLPPVVKNPFDCKKCHYSNQCFMYHRAIEKGNAKTSGAPEVFNSSAGHMTERYQKFFREWMSLIDLEEKDMGNLRRVNWSHTGDDIERKGVRLCLCFLYLFPSGFDHMLIQESYYKDNHTHYVFSRDPASEQAKEKKPLYASRLEVQDLLVISSTQGHSNLGAGTLVAIDHDTITIRTTTQLRKVPKKAHDFNEKDNQVYDYIQETDKGMAYRIERDPAFYTMSLLRTNIILLLSKAKHGGDEKRRRLIVDLCTPSFLVPGTIDIPKVPIFNTDQQQVMEKVLLAEDYALVAGYPGTGKTTTMAYIVKTLVELGKSVLIATHSNLSLDNLLMKLRKLGVDLIRLGSTDKVAILLDSFVLMGDHYQLSPVVSNEKALEKGLGKSLFSILAQAHPQTLVCLEHQYRMNKEIMGVCNALIYDNKLKCGNASVANRYLRIFAMKAGMEKIHRQVPAVPTEIEMCDGESCWLKDIMHPMQVKCFFFLLFRVEFYCSNLICLSICLSY